MYYKIIGLFKTIRRAIVLQYGNTQYKEYGQITGGFVGWWQDAKSGDCIAFLDEDRKVWLAW